MDLEYRLKRDQIYDISPSKRDNELLQTILDYENKIKDLEKALKLKCKLDNINKISPDQNISELKKQLEDKDKIIKRFKEYNQLYDTDEFNASIKNNLKPES